MLSNLRAMSNVMFSAFYIHFVIVGISLRLHGIINSLRSNAKNLTKNLFLMRFNIPAVPTKQIILWTNSIGNMDNALTILLTFQESIRNLP